MRLCTIHAPDEPHKGETGPCRALCHIRTLQNTRLSIVAEFGQLDGNQALSNPKL